MADKGIIFSAAMVRALLEGRKTQTRRLLNPQPTVLTGQGKRIYRDEDWKRSWRHGGDDDLPYAAGDRLYVREAWSHTGQGVWDIQAARMVGRSGVIYRSDGVAPGAKYWPSIHMPREFSRLMLLITEVRVQRLNAISEADAIAESCAGVLGPNPDFPDEWDPSPVEEFRDLWNSLHSGNDDCWEANPWVVAISFDVHHGNIDAVPQ